MTQYEENPVAWTAELLLEAVRSRFAEAAVELPNTQMITLGGQGSTAHLGEQLSISLEEMYSGTPGNQAQETVKCSAPQSAAFAVELVRCIPTGMQRGRSTPLPASEDAARQTEVSINLMRDIKLLMDAGMNAAAGTWFEEGIVTVSAAPPDGGLQALIMSAILVI